MKNNIKLKYRMIISIIRRLFYSIFVLWGISVVIFFISHIIPGDPARMALGAKVPEDVVQLFRIAMHYDKPIYVQYYYWVKGVLHGDLGVSIVTKHPVLEDIIQRFPATFELATFAFIFIVVIGITIGVISARYKNTWVDNLGRLVAYFGVVTPSYVFAIIGMLIFCYMLKILPSMGRLTPGLAYPPKITGLITIDALIQGNFIVFIDALKHLILPGISLGLVGIASEARITRISICKNMKKEYITAAQSYGIPERVIMFRDLLKPSLIAVTSLLGLEYATIFSQAFLIELIFVWPGFARYGMDAVLKKDLNAITGVVLILGVLFLLGSFIVDIIVEFLDPRIILIRERSE